MHALQVVVPFFIAGLGTCFAGILLDHVQEWDVFSEVNGLFIILPALLGLKGNLQMTLASRFSTHSHLGQLQTTEELLSLTCTNLSLNQCFSIIISFTASILAIIIQMVTSNSPFDIKNTLLITTTALLTSSVTSFLLDILMIMVVQASAVYNVNPDNVAIPIAASLGDITSLVLCSFLADLLYISKSSSLFFWITSLVILFYMILIPTWANVTQDNPHTKRILRHGSHWLPLITAMIISSISGVILGVAVAKSKDIALFQPVICGIGGNLVAVQASRLSSLLHRNAQLGKLPEGERICMNPIHILTSEKPGFFITRVLMIIVVPGQLIFYFILVHITSKSANSSMTFLLLYLVASQVQVVLLLYISYVLTYALWNLEVNPDNCTIPYLTSMSDVLGACLITMICLVAVPEPIKSF